MTRTDVIEKKEKSLAELLIIVMIIAILMASFLRYFSANEETIIDAGFEALANSFAMKVQVVHGQWLMDKQPNIVILKDATGEIEKINVNEFGWIDAINERGSCQRIWQSVMNLPLTFLKQPISAIEVNYANKNDAKTANDKKTTKVCRFALNQKKYFDYHTRSGKIVL